MNFMMAIGETCNDDSVALKGPKQIWRFNYPDTILSGFHNAKLFGIGG
jgi:hypothetical protein